FHMYVALSIEYTFHMQPVIELACREMSLDALGRKAAPVFPIWYKPEPPPPAGPPPMVTKPTTPNVLIPPLQGVVNSVFGEIDKGVDAFNDNVGKPIQAVQDFLNRPYKETPGGPFIDRAFGIGPAVPGSHLRRADELGQFAAKAFAKALHLK